MRLFEALTFGMLASSIGIVLAGCQSPAPAYETLEPLLAEPELLVFHGQLIPATDDPLVRELAELRPRIESQLGLKPSSKPVHIHLFENAESFRTFTSSVFPDLTDRRALFLHLNGTLSVFAQKSDSVSEDLRHEVTHGYLHASINDPPLWLDEGLAEYFETPRDARGFHARHHESLRTQLASGNWKPDLDRLEGFVGPGAMTQRDYAEAWVWVYWMLEENDQAKQILLEYLRQAQEFTPQPSLSVRLATRIDGDVSKLVAKHLLENPAPAVATN